MNGDDMHKKIKLQIKDSVRRYALIDVDLIFMLYDVSAVEVDGEYKVVNLKEGIKSLFKKYPWAFDERLINEIN